MLYGTYSEGRRRECSNCGAFTSVFTICPYCDERICDGCDHTCPESQEELN